MKPHTNDAIRRLDFIPESSFDSNKNYTKNANKIINGTKVSKKSDDEEWDARKTRKSWRPIVQNGTVAKSNRYKNLRSSRKETRLTMNVIDEEEDDLTSSNPSFNKTSPQNVERDGDDNVAVENIAERIKRRKENADIKTSEPEMESTASKRSRTATKKKALPERIDEDQATFSTSQDSTEADENFTGRTKRRKMSKRKSARNSTRTSSTVGESDGACNKSNSKFNYDSPPESCDEIECISESERPMDKLSDEELIEEQQRIERMLLQERADFELARRLQAEYDEMEQIAGRTRRSRRAIESERSVNVNAREINAARTVRRTSSVRKTVKRNPVVGTATKGKRGRPKRIKITVDAREDETRTR